MAIVKIGSFSSGTTPQSGDWSTLVKHFGAYSRQINGFQYPVEHVSGDNLLLKKGSYIQHGGSLYQVQTEDYTVSGTLSWVVGTYNYIKIEASDETLTATLTQDISSYSWSNIYNYLIASDESQILAFCASTPEGNSINIYRLEKKEIQYKSNQNTRTDDDVEFNKIILGNNLLNTSAGLNPFFVGYIKSSYDNTYSSSSDYTLPSMSVGDIVRFENEDGLNDRNLTMPSTSDSVYLISTSSTEANLAKTPFLSPLGLVGSIFTGDSGVISAGETKVIYLGSYAKIMRIR